MAEKRISSTVSMVSQGMFKRMGSDNIYSNSIQNKLQGVYRRISHQIPFENKLDEI